MKCIVIYFSQTGNTEKVAKAIHSGIKQAAGHCDIIKIQEADPRRLYQYDLIGLGCPVFHFEEPGNVRAFISDMRFVGGKHAFVFSTHGTVPDYFFLSIVPRLKHRGLIVVGMRDWYGDCLLGESPEPYVTAGHPDEVDLKEAMYFGKEMVEHSRRISAGEIALIPPPPPEPQLTFQEFNQQLKMENADQGEFVHASKHIKYHKEKCLYPECRLCMDNCPVYGIDLSVEPPVITKPCISCHFCTRICPTGAIEADAWNEWASTKGLTVLKNILIPHVEKAEAEGHFRRLVPFEKIGYETPVCKVHNKHPQWIIGKGIQ